MIWILLTLNIAVSLVLMMILAGKARRLHEAHADNMELAIENGNLRRERNFYRTKSEQAQFVIAALHQYPCDEISDDPRSGVGTVH